MRPQAAAGVRDDDDRIVAAVGEPPLAVSDGVRGLLTALLGQAAWDLRHAPRLRMEVLGWFTGSTAYAFGFVNVCTALDLDPGAVRRALGVTSATVPGAV